MVLVIRPLICLGCAVGQRVRRAVYCRRPTVWVVLLQNYQEERDQVGRRVPTAEHRGTHTYNHYSPKDAQLLRQLVFETAAKERQEAGRS